MNKNMRTEGLIAATFSTLNYDGSINLNLIEPLTTKLSNDGVKGVFICGTNGEGPNLTTRERMLIAEEYMRVKKQDMSVIVHVGHSSIKESQKLATHAQSLGVDAISAVSAFYFKPVSSANMVNCMAEIASAANKTPFYYYHIPAITGVSIDILEFLKLAEDKIPSMVGIKYTAATLHEYQACLNYNNGKYDVLFGYDELLLPALAVGAKGAIGSTYTFAAPLYLNIMKSFFEGNIDKARQLQFQAIQMIQSLYKHPSIAAQKAIFKMLNFDLGPCRLPLTALDEEQQQSLKTYLNSINFFEQLSN